MPLPGGHHFPMLLVHASCVALDGGAVLIRGPSGSGKSDLALRLMDGGARLVADDWTELRAEDGGLMAACPAPIVGLLEVRGLGLVPVEPAPPSPVVLVLDLVAPDRVERLPEPARAEFLGIGVARLDLAPFEASAVAKVRLAVASAKRDIMPS